MSKKNKRGASVAIPIGTARGVGDQRWEFSPWQLCLALLPYRIGTASAGAVKVETGRPNPVGADADAAERRRFYEAMLELPWLAPEVRSAVLKTLGRSYRAEKDNFGRGWTMALRRMVDETADRMKKNREHPPKGDIRTAAIEEIAEKVGIEPEALRGRFRRLSVDAT